MFRKNESIDKWIGCKKCKPEDSIGWTSPKCETSLLIWGVITDEIHLLLALEWCESLCPLLWADGGDIEGSDHSSGRLSVAQAITQSIY